MLSQASLGHVVWYGANALIKKLEEQKIKRLTTKTDELVSKYSCELLSSVKNVRDNLGNFFFSYIY